MGVDELLILLAQLRHVPLAEWSEETAIEYQQHVFPTEKISQRNPVAVEISQSECGRRSIAFDFVHGRSLTV